MPSAWLVSHWQSCLWLVTIVASRSWKSVHPGDFLIEAPFSESPSQWQGSDTPCSLTCLRWPRRVPCHVCERAWLYFAVSSVTPQCGEAALWCTDPLLGSFWMSQVRLVLNACHWIGAFTWTLRIWFKNNSLESLKIIKLKASNKTSRTLQYHFNCEFMHS